MISITAEEKKIIKEQFPTVYIARTMKQDSRRHHYYMTEDRGPMRLLNKLRDLDAPKGNTKNTDGGYGRKKARK